MRWAQLTLVENDPGRFDLQAWLDYFKRVDAVVDGPSIAADFNALLLEGCRRLDERRRGRPVDSTPPPPLTHPAPLA